MSLYVSQFICGCRSVNENSLVTTIIDLNFQLFFFFDIHNKILTVILILQRRIVMKNV